MRSISAQFTTKGKTFNKVTSAEWAKIGDQHVLALFRGASQNVPAYKEFLKKNSIDPRKIRTIEDFKKVPIVDKKNYLKTFDLEKLCWKGNLKGPFTYTSTSGSTGSPTYFPRDKSLDETSSLMHELFFESSGLNPNKSTLVVVCFGMGVWIGGLITYSAFSLMNARGYRLSIITPGINKKEIFEALSALGDKYDQIILCGYPPFIKDIIDEAPDHHVTFKKKEIRFVLAAEPFSEKFRDYLIKKGGGGNPLTSTMNIYGSADLGTMAEETPVCILIRRLLLKNKTAYQAIFKRTDKLPTLAQFNPTNVYFEESSGEIYCTGQSALPLIRYAIGDNGGVLTFDQIKAVLAEHGIDLSSELKKNNLSSSQLPFVFVFERKDMSTTLYGLQIYPEMIRDSLIEPALTPHLTGKFFMVQKYDADQNQYLEINLELQKNKKASPSLEKSVIQTIVDGLRARSSEFRELSNYLGERAWPTIVFWPYEDTTYFKTGSKQRWSQRV